MLQNLWKWHKPLTWNACAHPQLHTDHRFSKSVPTQMSESVCVFSKKHKRTGRVKRFTAPIAFRKSFFFNIQVYMWIAYIIYPHISTHCQLKAVLMCYSCFLRKSSKPKCQCNRQIQRKSAHTVVTRLKLCYEWKCVSHTRQHVTDLWQMNYNATQILPH